MVAAIEGTHYGAPFNVGAAAHISGVVYGVGIATTDKRFVIAHYDNPGFINRTVMNSLDYNPDGSFALRGAHQILNTSTFSNLPEGPVALASRYSGGFFSSNVVGAASLRRTGAGWDTKGHVTSHGGPRAIGTQYCFGNTNSLNRRGVLTMTGDYSLSSGKQMLVTELPLNQFGYFLASQGGMTEATPGGSAGKLCIGGAAIGRFIEPSQVGNSGSSGSLTLSFNPQILPSPSGYVSATLGRPGPSNAGTATVARAIFSNAVRITF